MCTDRHRPHQPRLDVGRSRSRSPRLRTGRPCAGCRCGKRDTTRVNWPLAWLSSSPCPGPSCSVTSKRIFRSESASDFSSSGNPSHRFASARSTSVDRGVQIRRHSLPSRRRRRRRQSRSCRRSRPARDQRIERLGDRRAAMPVTSTKSRVAPSSSFVSSLLMIGGIESTRPAVSRNTEVEPVVRRDPRTPRPSDAIEDLPERHLLTPASPAGRTGPGRGRSCEPDLACRSSRGRTRRSTRACGGVRRPSAGSPAAS